MESRSIVTTSQGQGRVPVAILRVRDRVNLGNADQLEQAARQVMAGGVHDILLDLTDVPSITSAGLRAILAIHQMLGQDASGVGGDPPTPEPSSQPWRSRHLKLLKPSPHVRQVLAVSGLDQYLDIHDSAEEALAAF